MEQALVAAGFPLQLASSNISLGGVGVGLNNSTAAGLVSLGTAFVAGFAMSELKDRICRKRKFDRLEEDVRDVKRKVEQIHDDVLHSTPRVRPKRRRLHVSHRRCQTGSEPASFAPVGTKEEECSHLRGDSGGGASGSTSSGVAEAAVSASAELQEDHAHGDSTSAPCELPQSEHVEENAERGDLELQDFVCEPGNEPSFPPETCPESASAPSDFPQTTECHTEHAEESSSAPWGRASDAAEVSGGASSSLGAVEDGEASRLLEKYPDRIPVICRQKDGSSADYGFAKEKFLVPGAWTWGKWRRSMGKNHLRCLNSEAVASTLQVELFVGDAPLPDEVQVSEVYQTYRADDGFLYVLSNVVVPEA